jgi:hypothetical protein
VFKINVSTLVPCLDQHEKGAYGSNAKTDSGLKQAVRLKGKSHISLILGNCDNITIPPAIANRFFEAGRQHSPVPALDRLIPIVCLQA